jgi:hypothetical protein
MENININGQRSEQRHTNKPNQDLKPITKSQRRFIITRTSNESNFPTAPVTIRNTINQARIQTKAPPQGNLVILTNETCMAKIVVHGIDLAIFRDDESGMTDLKNEIEKYNPKTRLMITPRYTTHPDKQIGKPVILIYNIRKYYTQ